MPVVRAAAILALVAAGLSLGSCATTCACAPALTAAPGAISEEAAIAAAKRQAPSATADPSVIWVNVTFDPFDTARPLVWEVRLEGPFAVPPCPAGFLDRPPLRSDAPCLDQHGGLVAVLDHFSGALLGWTH